MIRLYLLPFFFCIALMGESLDRTGPYISLGGGYTSFIDDGRMDASNLNHGSNINLIGGAFINKYLSVELGLDYFTPFTNPDNENMTELYFADAAAKAHYAFWRDRIDLYAAFGAGVVLWKETLNDKFQDDKAGSLRADLGVGFRALEWLTLNIGYRRYFFTLDDNYQSKDANGKEEYNFDRYHMRADAAYANIEVQF